MLLYLNQNFNIISDYRLPLILVRDYHDATTNNLQLLRHHCMHLKKLVPESNREEMLMYAK